MAEVYIVSVDNSTPVEITGGRVGHFRLKCVSQQQLVLGGASLAVSYPGSVETLTDGFLVAPANEVFDLYVTSPDEIYAALLYYNGGSLLTRDLKIFHCR